MAPLVVPRGGARSARRSCAPPCGRSPTARRSRRPSRRSRTCATAGFDVDARRGRARGDVGATSRRSPRGIGRPVGVPLEYDVSVYAHQLPGGMTSTLRRQLREVGLEDRWDDVLDGAAAGARGARLADHGHAALAVRRRAGVPQRDDRRALVADAGRGREVRARAVRPAAGRARPGRRGDGARLAAGRAVPRTRSTASTSATARARYGDAISDELLLLRMMLPAEQVEAMLARAARRPSSRRREHPVVDARRGPRRSAPCARSRSTAPGVRAARADEPARRDRRASSSTSTGRCCTRTTRAACAARIRSPAPIEAVARVRASGRRVLFFTNGTGPTAGPVRGRPPRARVRARRRASS